MQFLYNYFKKKAFKYEIKRINRLSDCFVEKAGNIALRIPTLFSGKGKIMLGNNVVFGFFPSPLFFNAYNHIEARNESSVIKIGDETVFNNNAAIVSNGAIISIGKKCRIGLNFQCFDSDFHAIVATDRFNEKAAISKNTSIGDNVFIGNNVICLKGAHIGSGCVVAANSVVTASIPCEDNAIIAGNPAKIIKYIKTEKQQKFSAEISPLTFSKKGNEKGWLIAFENSHNIPFDVKRVYYIFDTKQGVIRGKHAHKKSKQVLIAVSGTVEIHCETRGQKTVHLLDSPDKGLLIEGMVWHTMEKFSPDCVLMVLADDYYNEADYIRDYQTFLKEENTP